MRIIVAEDEPLTRKMTCSVLAREGHEVLSFEDGQSALEAFDEEAVPLVVTDWMMPRLTGLELTAAIRRRKLAFHTHVVIITSLSLEERTLEAFEAGADDLLAKPMFGDALRHKIRNIERAQLGQTETTLRDVVATLQSDELRGNAAVAAVVQQLIDVMRRQRSFARCRAFIRAQLEQARRDLGEDDPRTRKLAADLEELRARESLEEVA